MWQLFTNVVWVDDGTSVMQGNDAGYTGGAIAVRNASTLDLSTLDTAPAGQLMTISSNSSAGAAGGVYLRSIGVPAGGINRLRRLRINDNEATGDGGSA